MCVNVTSLVGFPAARERVIRRLYRLEGEAIKTLEAPKSIRPFGPDDVGLLMTPHEFDRADFDDGWRFELINGVLVATPLPLLNEIDPNQMLGYLLLQYQESHPQGAALNFTAHERIVKNAANRRRADRVIWAGLGRLPRRGDHPTIVVEFVSGRKRDRIRDYVTKRDEYLGSGVREYWVIDRFTFTMTVTALVRGRKRSRVIQQDEACCTDFLPGFELPLARLFVLANRWTDDQPE